MIPISKAEDRAKDIEAYLQATDPRFRRALNIVFDDGTSLLFQDAFIVEWKEYYLIFTEHHRFHVYHKDDVLHFQQYNRIYEVERVE